MHECLQVPDLSHSLLGELRDSEEISSCSIAEHLRIELDQSELKQQQLLVHVQQLSKEAAELKVVVKDLQGQLSAQKSGIPASVLAGCNPETDHEDRLNHYQSQKDLHERLKAAESKNMELLAKWDETLNERGQQTASYCDSAWKIQELIERLKTAEEEKLEAKREADERARHSERLSQDLKLREEKLKNTEEKLDEVKARAHTEREEALSRLEELQNAVGRIQGALTLKEKETGNLRAQLQDVQASLECRERQAEELRRRLQEEVEQRCGLSCEELEGQVLELRKTLKSREKDLTAHSEKIKHLEKQLEKLNAEAKSLCLQSDDSNSVCFETGNQVDYKNQCNHLMEVNKELLQTLRRTEESVTELTEIRVALLDQLAALKASEKQFKGRVEAAKMNVEDREKKLLDENLQLEETLQKMLIQNDQFDSQVKKLKRENIELLDTQSSIKRQLTTTQQELDFLNTKADMLANNLTGSQRCQVELLEKLNEAEAKLRGQIVNGSLLQTRVDELESGTMHHEKGAAECNEKAQTLRDEHLTSSSDTKEDPFKLVIAEAQLELNQNEVTRLREEVVELRAQLLVGNEEKTKVQALQEVTASSREDLRILSDLLKAQVEELNRRHVDEILRSREGEEALMRERDGEAQARVGLAAEVTASKEELDRLKLCCEALRLENSDSQEALHRANTETAELGVHVCMLTAQNEEARLRWEGLSSRLQEMEEAAAQEAERLNACMEQLNQENQELRSQLCDKEDLLLLRQKLQTELSEAQQEVEAIQKTSQEEIQALQLQLSSQNTGQEKQLQVRHLN